MPADARVPMFLCIDVEPDAHGADVDGPWDGLGVYVDLVGGLREALRRRSGVDPHPTWFLRMDPAIGECYGSVHHVVDRYGHLVDELRQAGDPLGLHIHTLRWDAERGLGYSDFTDGDWAGHCVRTSATAFADCFAETPLRARQGSVFLSEEILAAEIQAGIRVDLTPEPGLPAMADDLSFGDHAIGTSTDFRRFPRHPYRPQVGDASADGGAAGREITLVPLTSSDFLLRTRFRSWAKAQVLGRRPTYRPLSPWRPWPSPSRYWDLVARALDRMDVPYLAVAIRTYPADFEAGIRQSAVLRALPEHPISERLEICDPLRMALT